MKGSLAVIAIGVIGLAVTFFSSYTTIPSGWVGVRTTFKKINPEPLNPGIRWFTPFVDKVTPIDCRLKSFEVQTNASTDDQQLVKMAVSVQHSMVPAMAPKGMAEIGGIEAFDATVIRPAVLESIKAVTAEYTAAELISKRTEVKTKIDDAIKGFIEHTLQGKDIAGALDIDNVAITDFDFSDEFNASIEAKVRADQVAQQALSEKKKTITEAEAAARQKELAADADAYEIDKKSIAAAAAIEREAKALANNPNLLQLRYIEQWDGVLPKFSGSGEVVPFLNVGEFAADTAK